jgi:RimJ/RimL family protein N-acetyltransferase
MSADRKGMSDSSAHLHTVPPVLAQDAPIASGITVPALTLTRAGVSLRLHRRGDVAEALECHADPLGTKWATLPTEPTVEAYGQWLEEVGMTPTRDLVLLAIEVDGRFAGQAGLRAHSEDGGVVFYITSPWVRGRGVAAIAAALLADYALTQLGWNVVTWQAHVGNVASAKTAWRAGFPPAVVVPATLPFQGRLVDAWHSVQTHPVRGQVVPWEQFLPGHR